MKNLQGLHLSDSSASSSPVQMPGRSANSKGSLCIMLNLLFRIQLSHAGFLLEAGSRVLAPVYFEKSAQLLKVRNIKKKQQENKTLSTLTKY